MKQNCATLAHSADALPDYYRNMYLDGFTPYEIMASLRKSMIRQHEAHDIEKTYEQPSGEELAINSEVTINGKKV